MQINKSTDGPVTILEPLGDMGLYNLGQLRTLLQELRADGNTKVLLDMGKVPGIDSISIGFLIQETEFFIEQRGELKLARISASVRKSLQVTETLQQLNVFDSVAAALDSFKRP
jgi:anti-anti-sigma factor